MRMHGCELVFLFVVLSTQSCLFYRIEVNPFVLSLSKDERIFSFFSFPRASLAVIHKCPRDVVILASAEGFCVGRAVRALGSAGTCDRI